MTIILGIHPGHDSGAALIKDGKILAAADEERFRRQKFWGGDYPKNSINFVMEYTKTKIEDVDAIAIPAKKFTIYDFIKIGARYVRYPSVLLNRVKKTREENNK